MNLTFEISKRILNDIGIEPGRTKKDRGLFDDDFLLKRKMAIQYDKSEFYHNIYGGELIIGESKIRGILVDLGENLIDEYIFVFKMDTLPTHVVKTNMGNVLQECFIKIHNELKNTWMATNMYQQAKILADFERIVSYGFLWHDCNSLDDLVDVAAELLIEG